MSPPRPEFSHRLIRWLLPAALLAIVPKCLLCVLAYVGLGAAFGLGGTEICGGSDGTFTTWATSFAWLGVAGGVVTLGLLASSRCMRLSRRVATERGEAKLML